MKQSIKSFLILAAAVCFGNQKLKAAKRSKGALEEEMRRLNGGD